MRRLTAGLLTVCLLGIGAGSALAQSPSPSPEVMGWRVEVPAVRLALTLPIGWGVWVRMMDASSRVGLVDDPDRSWWIVLDADTPHQFPDPGTGGCRLWLLRTNDPDADATTLQDLWPDAAMYWNKEPNYQAAHTTTEVLLPAGSATRFDFAEEFPFGVKYHADYRFAAPDGVAWLLCRSLGIALDDSIAETLEFLVEE